MGSRTSLISPPVTQVRHIAFLTAYLISAGACVVLIGAYLVHALQSRLRGIGFAGGLVALYAALYGLLASEDNALLLGACLLFLALGVVMMATRKLDWYSVAESPVGGE